MIAFYIDSPVINDLYGLDCFIVCPGTYGNGCIGINRIETGLQQDTCF